ncbi:MAG: photosystem II assembly protein [Xenococcaceae cyanobacterium]
MLDKLVNWWRSYQFRAALKGGNQRQAKKILREIEKSGSKLSWLEQLFKKQLKSEESLSSYRRELASLSRQLQEAVQRANKIDKDDGFIKFISQSFKLIKHDNYKLQCTGIEERIFSDFEATLANFLQEEFSKIPEDKLYPELEKAIQDIEGLKSGVDPNYSCKLTPHAYFMKYFLENVYCAYLAWFLIYQAGLIPRNIKILDIAAGLGTVAYGLALLLQSSSNFFPMPQMHISYYSLEQQAPLQYRGLQFWRRYIEPQQTATNAYFRFDTADIFDYHNYSQKLPEAFFDFIVISHCFFYEAQQRLDSHNIYRKIFQKNIATGGYVLLIVQGRKLFNAYNVHQSEDIDQEQSVIKMFLEELGLQLEWYKYLTSTAQRTPMEGAKFASFARENLPKMKYMNPLKHQYLEQKFASNYAIDDYVILARR